MREENGHMKEEDSLAERLESAQQRGARLPLMLHGDSKFPQIFRLMLPLIRRTRTRSTTEGDRGFTEAPLHTALELLPLKASLLSCPLISPLLRVRRPLPHLLVVLEAVQEGQKHLPPLKDRIYLLIFRTPMQNSCNGLNRSKQQILVSTRRFSRQWRISRTDSQKSAGRHRGSWMRFPIRKDWTRTQMRRSQDSLPAKQRRMKLRRRTRGSVWKLPNLHDRLQ